MTKHVEQGATGEVHRADRVVVRGLGLEVAWWGPESHRTIVMLHEGLGSVSRWRDVPAKISAATGLGVMAYSRFGYGRSDALPLPRSVDYLYEEAALFPEVAAAAGLAEKELVLFGHSDGGSIALIHAASGAAKNVAGLVLEAPHVFVEDLSIASIEAAREEFLSTDLAERMKKHHQDPHAAFWGWNRAWLHPDFRAFDIVGLLPRVRVPALVIQGAEDQYGTLKQVETIARELGAPVEELVIPGARHSAHTDATDLVVDEVRDFVARL